MHFTQKAKKAVAAGLALSTVMWSAAFFVTTPVLAAPHSEGCLVNSGGTVWLISGGQRRGFTSAEVFASHGYNFGQVIAANAEDAALPEGPILVYADGSLVKGPNDPLVYLVANGQKRGFTSGSVFTGLGYSFANIQWAPVNTFSDLPTGSNVESSTERHPAGTLVKDGSGTVWWMTATGRKGVPSMEVFNSYGKSWNMVVAANAADLATANEGVLTARATCTDGSGPVGSVSATLASNNPASMTLVAGQSRAELARFTFNGSGTVTNLKLMRTGVSADSTLSAVYLYDGATRLTDNASVSSSVITFNDPSGLFTVSGSRTISVQANIATGTTGQTVGVSVSSFAMTNGTGTGAPSGNLHTIANVSDFATIDFNTTTTPATSTISPQADYTMWQNTVSVGVRKVWLKSIAFRQIGSVLSADLGNFKLFVDGTQKGSTVGSLDSKGYLTFDLSGAPVELNTGSRTVKVVGDIINGSSRNFSFSLQQAGDAWFTDSNYNAGILPTAASATFSARSSGTQTISSGTLTVNKRTDSPSTDLVNEASGQVLGRFDVKAFGENMKVESFRVRVDDDDDSTAFTLRNGQVFVDGSQVGSTTAIAADTDTTLGYTEFTFGSSFVVMPGTARVLEIRADVYDNDGTNNIIATDTLQVEVGAGTNNVQRMTSLSYETYPASYVEGNVLTVSTGSVTVAKNTSVSDNTFVAPSTAQLLGSFNIQASSTEGATITSVEIDTTTADAFSFALDVNNLYLVMGSYTAPIKSTVTADDNTFSTNVSLSAGQSLVLNVYGDVLSTASDGGTADTVVIEPTVSYTTVSSGTSSTSNTSGQTMTAGSGSFTISLDGSSPLSRVVAGNQEVTAGVYKFQASNDAYTVSELDVTVPTANAGSAVTAVKLYDGATQIGPVGGVPFVGNDADSGTNNKAAFTGLNWSIGQNVVKTLTVKFVLNNIGTSAGISGQNAKAQIDRTRYQAQATGTVTAHATDYDANETYVYKSIPTLAISDLSNTSSLVNGQAQDVYKFTVTAGTQGAVSIKQFKLPISWSDGGTADTLELESFKLFEDGVDVTANVLIQDDAAADIEDATGALEANTAVVVSWGTGLESTVAAGGTKTYTVRATPQAFRMTGADTVGDSVSLYGAGDSTHNGTSTYLNAGTATVTIVKLYTSAAAGNAGATGANFIWSDNSSTTHVPTMGTTSSGDWFNGYKVLNFDLAGETWSK